MEGLARFETHFAHAMNSHLYGEIEWEGDGDAAFILLPLSDTMQRAMQ